MVETTKDAVKRIIRYSTIKRTIIYNGEYDIPLKAGARFPFGEYDDTLKPCFGCIYGTHALCGDCVKHSESKFNALHIRKVDEEPISMCKHDGLCCDACRYMKAKDLIK
jgi:hypothetical protein